MTIWPFPTISDSSFLQRGQYQSSSGISSSGGSRQYMWVTERERNNKIKMNEKTHNNSLQTTTKFVKLKITQELGQNQNHVKSNLKSIFWELWIMIGFQMNYIFKCLWFDFNFQITIFVILPNSEITYWIRTLHKIIVSQDHLCYHRQCIHILCICVLDLFCTFCKVVPIQRLVQDNQFL